MTLEILDTFWAFGDFPSDVLASTVALEAGVSEAEATAMIQAAWAQAEVFTGRSYRPVTAGQIVCRVTREDAYRWPRYPFPDAVTFEVWGGANGWTAHTETYVAGLMELTPHTLNRVSQVGVVTPPTPGAHVIQAVTNLALYQLIQMPQRREFASQSAGDTSLSREALKGLFYGSGAGILLAPEVRQ